MHTFQINALIRFLTSSTYSEIRGFIIRKTVCLGCFLGCWICVGSCLHKCMKLYSTAAAAIIIIIIIIIIVIIIILESTTSKKFRKQSHEVLRSYFGKCWCKKGQNVYCGIQDGMYRILWLQNSATLYTVETWFVSGT